MVGKAKGVLDMHGVVLVLTTPAPLTYTSILRHAQCIYLSPPIGAPSWLLRREAKRGLRFLLFCLPLWRSRRRGQRKCGSLSGTSRNVDSGERVAPNACIDTCRFTCTCDERSLCDPRKCSSWAMVWAPLPMLSLAFLFFRFVLRNLAVRTTRPALTLTHTHTHT